MVGTTNIIWMEEKKIHATSSVLLMHLKFAQIGWEADNPSNNPFVYIHIMDELKRADVSPSDWRSSVAPCWPEFDPTRRSTGRGGKKILSSVH